MKEKILCPYCRALVVYKNGKWYCKECGKSEDDLKKDLKAFW